MLLSKLSKQELYFVKKYAIFGTDISAREKRRQNISGPHKGVIVSNGPAILNLFAGQGVPEPPGLAFSLSNS